MNVFTTMFTTVALLASSLTEAQTLIITRAGARPVRTAPAENFTGTVRVETLFEPADPSHASGGSVTFEPGARTAWHSHPRGQILIVTAGIGRVQRWGDPIEEVRVGDVDRSLVTIAALAATGDDDELDVFLRRGVESGLTPAQITEAFTHLGFYAGWPKATKAIAAALRTLAK